MKKALITGITGQDGSYLAELLLEKGYEVHGMVRRTSLVSRGRLDALVLTPEQESRLHLHYGDLTDSGILLRLLDKIRPDEIYNLASQSHVRVSFDLLEHTLEVNGTATGRLLEAIRELGLIQSTRFYQASSSEMFGWAESAPQNERTPFYPRSPYACAKVMAHWLTVNFRESYGLFGCSGILFNHESPRRGENFVTRKITIAAARIKAGLEKKLVLGNIDARRDWGYAKEYVEGMWRMLQHETPADYVLATGEDHSIRDFLEASFTHVGLDWQDYVEFDPKFLRPVEGRLLVGDYSKAKNLLGWEPQTRMKQLAALMVEADLDTLRVS